MLRIRGPALLTNEISEIKATQCGGLVVSRRVRGFFPPIIPTIKALFRRKTVGHPKTSCKTMIYKIGFIVLLHNRCVSSRQVHSPLVLTVHLNKMRVVGPFQSSGQPGKGSLETSFWRENDNICRVWLCTAPQVGCLLIH